MASTCRDDQKALLDLLTETDCTEKVSESAQALKEGGKKSTVPKFCATRWTARISTLSALLSKYIDVIKALQSETPVVQMPEVMLPLTYDCWKTLSFWLPWWLHNLS